MKKWTKAYQQYRERFYAEKQRGNIMKGVRVFNQRQFSNAMKVKTKEGSNKYTVRKLLNKQMIFTSKKEEDKTWRIYLRMRKEIERGEKIIVHDSFMGLTETAKGGISISEAEEMQEKSGIGFHYKIEALLKDRYALHDIIAFRIAEGEEQKEVLADYGY